MRNRYNDLWINSQKPGGEKNLLDYLIYRRLSTLLLLLIADRRFSPNHITTVSVLFSFLTGTLFAISSNYWVLLTAVFFMNLSLITDTLDGQYSRYTDQSSEFGAWYDTVSDCLKYIFIFIGLCIGSYRFPRIEEHVFSNVLAPFNTHPEYSLLAGLLVLGNIFMIYYIHGTRYKLKNNLERIIRAGSGEKQFHFGIESTLYTIFTVFLLFGQTIWLLIFLVFTLPILWIGPFFLVYQNYRKNP